MKSPHSTIARLLTALLLLPVMLAGAGKEKKKRVVIDLFGGWSMVSPSNLNGTVEADRAIHDVLFTQNYASWYGLTNSSSGDFHPLRSLFPAGVRAHFRSGSFVGFVVSLSSFLGQRSSSPVFEYSNSYFNETKRFTGYALDASALMPTVGIKIEKRIGHRLTAGLQLHGGPLFARLRHYKEWEWTLFENDPTMLMTFQEKGSYEMKGHGTGANVELLLRLSRSLGKKTSLFLEGGYAFRRVWSVSGAGSETRNDFQESWEGKWKMKREEMRGASPFAYPTNRPSDEALEDFVLDLSGGQLHLGISIALGRD